MKNKEALALFRRTVMLRAWGFIKRGVISMSISLRLAWAVAKGKISEKDVVRKMFKTR
ncbi:hypothetical protein CLV98_1572 [Dyadobacter jejuensis]|uniref:Uncharacterized protein n=1 Tax=Dyadobacter jejuensis TaxID=1082580 RepID=A0A315ZS51_9BACT|nr:hypothetical protein CLV98_1572 [Dyadobacter jejuensis]